MADDLTVSVGRYFTVFRRNNSLVEKYIQKDNSVLSERHKVSIYFDRFDETMHPHSPSFFYPYFIPAEYLPNAFVKSLADCFGLYLNIQKISKNKLHASILRLAQGL
ncbi:MAG: hypothetical protein M3R72_05640 [Bacteroidota bacterium]|nr:hypothetical protein [Bacteroidota bacterium]